MLEIIDIHVLIMNILLYLIAEVLTEGDEDYRQEDSGDENGSARHHSVGNSFSGYTPTPGGSFSALTSSMWPQDILAKLAQVCFNSAAICLCTLLFKLFKIFS